jgi:hypothetical protein
MKNRATALQSSAKAGLQQAKKKPSGSSRTNASDNTNIILGGLALAVGAFVGGIVLERKKGIVGQAEEAVSRGKAAAEAKVADVKKKAEATKKAIQETVYGRTDPEWKVVTDTYQTRIINDVYYEVVGPSEEGVMVYGNNQKLAGPGENFEWTTVNAAKKYIDRISKAKKNPEAPEAKGAGRGGRGGSKGRGKAEPTPAQMALRQETLDAVGQHGQRREFADPEQYMHMVCLYPSARDFDAEGEPDPADSILGAYANLDNPDVLACLVPGMIVDVFVCVPCEDDDEEPEVIDNVTVELTGKAMKAPPKAPKAPKAPAKTTALTKTATPARANVTPAKAKGRKA